MRDNVGPEVLVPDEPPQLGEQAGVRAVAADDVDRTRRRGPGEEPRAAPALLRRPPQPGRVDAEVRTAPPGPEGRGSRRACRSTDWARAAAPQPTAKLATTAPGRPSARRGRRDGIQPDDGESDDRPAGRVRYEPRHQQPGDPCGQQRDREVRRTAAEGTAPGGDVDFGGQGRPASRRRAIATTWVSKQAPPAGRGPRGPTAAGDDRSEAVEDVPDRLEAARQAGEEVGEPRLDGGRLGGAGCGDRHERGGNDHPNDVTRSAARSALGDHAEHRRGPAAADLAADVARCVRARSSKRSRVVVSSMRSILRGRAVTGEGSASATPVGSTVCVRTEPIPSPRRARRPGRSSWPRRGTTRGARAVRRSCR